jgi:BirA family biotin operon repressor/biotin-[acetyl-CoA-carboxylase] ligase
MVKMSDKFHFDIEEIFLDHTDSTNAYAARVKPGEKKLIIIRTNYQSSGKGQGHNSWESEPGENLLMSIVLNPSIDSDKAFYLSKIVAISLVRLCAGLNIRTQIKWPNDIIYEKKKIAGILIENTIMGKKIVKCTAGLGLNVNQMEFSNFYPEASSLKLITGKSRDIAQLKNDFAAIFISQLSLLQENQWSKIDEEYFASLYGFGKKLKFKHEGKLRNFRFTNVSESGMLEVRDEEGKMLNFGFGELDWIF